MSIYQDFALQRVTMPRQLETLGLCRLVISTALTRSECSCIPQAALFTLASGFKEGRRFVPVYPLVVKLTLRGGRMLVAQHLVVETIG